MAFAPPYKQSAPMSLNLIKANFAVWVSLVFYPVNPFKCCIEDPVDASLWRSL